MTLSLHAIALAITICAPATPAATARTYAAIVRDSDAVKAGADPLLIVVNVDGESGWTPGAVNPKSGALGLGQVLPRYRPACSKKAGGLYGASCLAEKKKLLDGFYNLRVTVEVIATWAKVCGSRGWKGEASWLTAYAGAGTKDDSCDPGSPIRSLVRSRLARRRALRLRLEAMLP